MKKHCQGYATNPFLLIVWAIALPVFIHLVFIIIEQNEWEEISQAVETERAQVWTHAKENAASRKEAQAIAFIQSRVTAQVCAGDPTANVRFENDKEDLRDITLKREKYCLDVLAGEVAMGSGQYSQDMIESVRNQVFEVSGLAGL